MRSYYIGSDIGGTFTDCVLLDDSGALITAKSPSTPPRFAEGLMNALEEIAARIGEDPTTLFKHLRNFSHGCTVATNTMINRDGARVGLVTTKGFEETLFMMRGSAFCQGLPTEAWFHKPQNQRPFEIVPLDCVVGITERVDKDGEVLVPLNEDELIEAGRYLVEQKGCQALAIAFLWSFLNPNHERRASEILRERYPEINVDASHQILPAIGEYERASTTVINSYLRTQTERYIHELMQRLEREQFRSNFYIMQANGGLIHARHAASHAVRILHSGPTGGVIAARIIGERIGSKNIITSDMGGTSFDISLIANGEIQYTTRSYQCRHVVSTPMVDIESIGAGGGSIAYVDAEGLKVGPQSAGADPGPACYGRGGTRPTVTDANLVLGYLNPDYFLGSRMKLHKDLAERAILEHVANPLGLDLIEAASGIYRIVNAHMADAIRFHVFQRGYDPRDFDLFLFGGATPAHGAAIGEDLNVRSIIVPLAGLATVFSAFGIANCDVLRFHTASRYFPLRSESMEELEKIYAALIEKGKQELFQEGFTPRDIEVQRIASMRYHLQLTNIEVRLPDKRLTPGDAEEVIYRFDTRYAQLYGESAGFKEAGRDIVSEFVQITGRTPKGRLEPQPVKGPNPFQAFKGRRPVYFPSAESFLDTPLFDGDRLEAGNTVIGPAILEMTGTTVVVPPAFSAKLDPFRNILLERILDDEVSKRGTK